MPAPTLVTIPEVLTVAIAVALLLQVPPLMAPVRVRVVVAPPVHMAEAPVMVPAAGNGLMVMVWVVAEVAV